MEGGNLTFSPVFDRDFLHQVCVFSMLILAEIYYILLIYFSFIICHGIIDRLLDLYLSMLIVFQYESKLKLINRFKKYF